MPPAKPKHLPATKLRRRFDPSQIPFETSAEAKRCFEQVLGQSRAREALEFGLAMEGVGYHVFVAGPPRTGKTHLVTTHLERLAKELPPPPDWVYVYNFKNPDEPAALRLPPGGGRQLTKEMDRLLEKVKLRVPALFESEGHSKKREEVVSQFKKVRTEIFSELDKFAQSEGYVLKFEPTGIMVAPADDDGQVMPEERIRELSADQRAKLRDKSDLIQGQVTESLRKVSAQEKELEQALKELDQEMVLATLGPLFDELFDKYNEHQEVYIYLERVRENLIENFQRFQKKEAPQMALPVLEEPDQFKEFKVNLFVDNSGHEGAPVVMEDHPTFPNLFGRIERQAKMGALHTDFTLLRPGSLHKANGGFLVLPILEVLKLGLPWDGLKRALIKRKVVIEDAMEQYGFMNTRSLRPEPVPLDLKVVLVGETGLFDLLYSHDPQFSKLFKVRAQMAERMDWKRSEVRNFVNHLCVLAKDNKGLPLHRGAVAGLIELAAELAGDSEKLTLRLAEIKDVVGESQYFAKKAKHQAVMAEDVERAVQMRRRRVNMIEERMREGAVRGFINLETEGSRVGQINGLAVIDTGDHAFGMPSRISASLGLGKGGVVNVEREAKLSGPFHTKGVLILSGFLLDKFGQDGPLTLSAGLTFEQSYSMIDGDSASLAELLVLLSRISGAPLRQDLAVTGSVSQKGQVQAIGGVNHKIEGFFKLCRDRGLTGSQGVVIPRANVVNLMLSPEVVAAAQKGRFHIHAAGSVEQALELFSGLKAGRLLKSGRFSKDSVYELARQELVRLRDLAGPDKSNGALAKKESSGPGGCGCK